MLNIFKSKSKALDSFSVLGVDLHSHLLPGIDDGSPDMATSLELIGALKAFGYRHLITTPHVMSELYPNTHDTIRRKRDEVLVALEESGMEIGFEAAAEYYIDESFIALYKKEPLLTLPGNRVLVEQSMMQPYPELQQVLFDLQMKGYQPVLAHPERYSYYRHLEELELFTDRNIELQVNLLSLTGYYGSSVRKMAKQLIEKALLHFLATDLHHERHAQKLEEVLKEPLLAKAAGKVGNGDLVIG